MSPCLIVPDILIEVMLTNSKLDYCDSFKLMSLTMTPELKFKYTIDFDGGIYRGEFTFDDIINWSPRLV